MKVTIALTVAIFGFVTSSAALKANKNNVRTTHKDDGIAVKGEGKVDVINKIQLEDQAFWKRSLSISMSHLGVSYNSSGCSNSCDCCITCHC